MTTKQRDTSNVEQRSATGWVRDGHRVSLVADEDSLTLKIMCPGEGLCQSKTTCWHCSGAGKYVDGPFDDSGPAYREVKCDACDGTGHEREDGHDLCHLKQWAEATEALEYHDGDSRALDGVVFPAEIRWRYTYSDEGPEWRFANVVYKDEREPKEIREAGG